MAHCKLLPKQYEELFKNIVLDFIIYLYTTFKFASTVPKICFHLGCMVFYVVHISGFVFFPNSMVVQQSQKEVLN